MARWTLPTMSAATLLARHRNSTAKLQSEVDISNDRAGNVTDHAEMTP
jgi:hypothetical protein